jgi:transposase
MSIKAIADHLRTSWDLIKKIQKNHLQKKYATLKAKDLRFLAIDEIASHKGHKYLTVVMDLETGAVIYVGEGRKSESLDKLWRKLGRYKKNLWTCGRHLLMRYHQTYPRQK